MAATMANALLVPATMRVIVTCPLLAVALQLLPLSFSEQQPPNAILNIFNICSFLHMHPINKILHGNGVEVREHLDRHHDLSQLLWYHA
jgi:hypothetical protein